VYHTMYNNVTVTGGRHFGWSNFSIFTTARAVVHPTNLLPLQSSVKQLVEQKTEQNTGSCGPGAVCTVNLPFLLQQWPCPLAVLTAVGPPRHYWFQQDSQLVSNSFNFP